MTTLLISQNAHDTKLDWLLKTVSPNLYLRSSRTAPPEWCWAHLMFEQGTSDLLVAKRRAELRRHGELCPSSNPAKGPDASAKMVFVIAEKGIAVVAAVHDVVTRLFGPLQTTG
jgi:hypothetical protein